MIMTGLPPLDRTLEPPLSGWSRLLTHVTRLDVGKRCTDCRELHNLIDGADHFLPVFEKSDRLVRQLDSLSERLQIATKHAKSKCR